MSVLGTIDLGDGAQAITVDHDPTVTATDAPTGSLVINVLTAVWYRKLDSGLTTNFAIASLTSGAVVSGSIVSGTIGSFELSSGAVRSGHIGDAAVVSGSIGSGQIASGHMASGFVDSLEFNIGSGSVQSGTVGSGAVFGFFGPVRNIASGTIGVFDFGSGAVIAGTIGSGAVQSVNIASGAVTSSKIGAGAVISGNVADGAIQSGAISSGQIGQNHLSSGSVTSGAIASGQVGPFKLSSGAVQSGNIASGAIITYARNVVADRFTCTETISGVRCVIFDAASSGQIRIAMAAVSGRMPAIGIVFENQLSGDTCLIVRRGDVVPPSAVMGSGVAISGRIGKSLWVGASGSVVVLSGGGPTIGVGATNSGAWGQRMGTTSTSGAILVDVVPFQQFSGAANITTNFQQWPV